MKKTKIIFSVFVTLVLAYVAYALATDTDGGDNPFQRGTCSEDLGANFTDTCVNGTLIEYYPNASQCLVSTYDCADFNYVEGDCSHTFTCKVGRCKEKVSCFGI